MVFRVYSEKRPEFSEAAEALKGDIRDFLGIKGLSKLRIVNRYDVEGIDEATLDKCIPTVFSEPQVDFSYRELDAGGAHAFAVAYLPGQFDQRADSAAQCISLVTAGDKPAVRSATVYLLYGELSQDDIAKIKGYIINPVDSMEAELSLPKTLAMPFAEPPMPEKVDISGEPADIIKKYGLAMDEADLRFVSEYFGSENRQPTMTELRVIDTYWSDHCRHTTFNTELKNVEFEDKKVEKAFEGYLALREKLGVKKPVCLMDIAVIAAKALKRSCDLKNLDESREINACTVRVNIEVDGKEEPWLLLFKNETHNHPTEIEPFGGAATCVGGAIRDPLSGRSYVYHAMRVTGGADPLRPLSETIKGKLPQRKLVTTAAHGYSSYGNQIGLATGLVDEVYHDGYLAKHMEIGAVVGAAPAKNVRRDEPLPGDVVILLGGRTGRDGCGGATGSSKSHDESSLASCGAEVQKGNAPEERKLQRLFMNPAASTLIKCCNDFGAGGVSVAIGELADGLEIDLNAVPKKYAGLDGTELAISESQERMAVVVAPEDAEKFLALAHGENLEATVVARVTGDRRMVMKLNGERIVDISRDFLDTNGAGKKTSARVASPTEIKKNEIETAKGFKAKLEALVSDINICSRQGLSEMFDSTIGAGTVLMPFGGRNMLTPPQAMAAKFPVRTGETDNCSVMSYGFDPYLSEADPYAGAYCAVISSVAKLAATGAGIENCWLTFQEYFEKMKNETAWGKPLSALLGALDAQMGLRLAAIGGKDSMSGSFENISVPPTLVSFAVSADKAENIVSPEFKGIGTRIMYLPAEKDENGLPKIESVRANIELVTKLLRSHRAFSCWAVDKGGIMEGIFKMAIGNGIGFEFDKELKLTEGELFARDYGAFILETPGCGDCGEAVEGDDRLVLLGKTTEGLDIRFGDEAAPIYSLYKLYDEKLESVYRHKTADASPVMPINCIVKSPKHRVSKENAPLIANGEKSKPKVLIPVFPGTNCEMDSARAMRLAGAEAEILVINNLSAKDIEESVKAFSDKLNKSNILFIPGGFSGGDEPEGSAKLITSFMRNNRAADAIMELLDRRDGLILGICNGFQALIKLGLVPYGRIVTASDNAPTLTYNTIGVHRSRLVHTRCCSNLSPWLMHREVGDVTLVPVSHGEGRFVCSEELLAQLVANGQVATQYCDDYGTPSMRTSVNPNGSVMAIEGITSMDGRVFGKMAHSERCGQNLYKNVPGADDFSIFRGAVDYFVK